MKLPQTGSRQCGALRYQISEATLYSVLVRCAHVRAHARNQGRLEYSEVYWTKAAGAVYLLGAVIVCGFS
jgi:hypothetical protein